MKWPWRTAARDTELNEELESHIAQAVEQRVRRGEPRDVARANALREFGNTTHVAEVTREMWGGAWWDSFVRDTRYALRGLRRSPGFTTIAVATFALGIAANTAMFTIVNGVLLKPLPFAHPEQLVMLLHYNAEMGAIHPSGLSDHTYAELRSQPMRAFSSTATYIGAQMTLTGNGDADRLKVARATATFMSTLGASPAIGRTFGATEEEPGNNHVVVLSDQLWRTRFAGAHSVLGTSIVLDGVSHIVIGVMPPTFDFPPGTTLWTPLLNRVDPNVGMFRPTIARLVPGASLEAARRELDHVISQLPSSLADKPQAQFTEVTPMADLIVAKAKPSLIIFSGAVCFVLLIACANVANLLLMRASARRHEIGVRVALGAGRAQVVRQLVTESVLIAVFGGAIGLVLSAWGVSVLVATAPAGRIPRGQDIGVDWRVLAVAFGVSLVAGVVCGIFPALSNTRSNPRDSLASSARTVAGSHDAVRRVFVIAQLALAIVLTTGAGLLLKSFARMHAVDLGFRANGVVTFNVNLSSAAFPNPTDVHTFDARVLDRLRQIPGVELASMVNWMPLGGALMTGNLRIDGLNTVPKGYPVDKLVTAPTYFGTMGIRMFAGRDFDAHDNATSTRVTIITRSTARKFWPPEGLGAIGQRLTEADENPQPADWATIVGVVDDIDQRGATGGRHNAQYFPVAQLQDMPWISDVTFVVSTTRTAPELTPVFRAVMHELNPEIAVRNVQSMDDAVAASMGDSRFETRLLTIFAMLALVLAAVGTYGVLAYDVAARTRELGVRVALGAASRDVVRVVMRRTLALVIPGLTLGLISAFAVTRVLQKSLFEVTTTDPATFGAVAGVLLVVALVAGIAPMRRAIGVDPMTVLRN